MPPLNSHRPRKMATLLAERIVGEITDEELAPGLMLPPEREMLERYGVARGTLREALRFLEMQGVVSMKPGPGGGPVVNAPDAKPLAGAIALLLQRSNATFRTILEARQLLEPSMAAMAATRGDAQDLAVIEESIVVMRRDLGDLRAFLHGNQVFHGAIGRASGNQLFDYLLNSLSSITDATNLGVDYPERWRPTVLKAHERIFERIRAQDAAGAEKAMRRHIDDFSKYLEHYYPRVLEQRLRWELVVH